MTTVSIGTVAELQAFATRVNAGETDLDAILTADINLTGVSWTPIGTSSNAYAGTFDGDGHTISDITIGTSSSKVSTSYLGLFAYCSNAHITSVRCANFAFYTTGGYCSAICCYNTGSTLIEKCIVTNFTVVCGEEYCCTTAFCGPSTSANLVVKNCIVDGFDYTITGTNGRNVGALLNTVGSAQNCIVTDYNSHFSSPYTNYGNGALGGYNPDTYIYSSFVKDSNTGTSYGYRCGGLQCHITSCYADANTVTVNEITQSSTDSNSRYGANAYSSDVSGTPKYDVESFWTTTSNWGSYPWDFTNTWYWDTTSSLPKLQVFRQASAPTVKVFNATSNTWVDGAPYVFNGTSWVQASKVYVYNGTSGAWVEKT